MGLLSVAAIGIGSMVEYIPQIDSLTTEPMRIENGFAIPSPQPGLGIAWDFGAIRHATVPGSDFVIS